MVWAALSSLSSLPIPDTSKLQHGKSSRSPPTKPLNCVFRVVRVSGTIRKAEEEAVRRAREEIRTAKRLEEVGGEGGGLDAWLGSEKKGVMMKGKEVENQWDGRSDEESSDEELGVDG